MPEQPTLTEPPSAGARRLRYVLTVLITTGAALFVIDLVLGLTLVGRRGGGPIQGWDNTVQHWSITHRGGLVGVDKVVATYGDAAPLAVLSILLSIILLAWLRSPRALAPVLAYLGGEGLVFMIREVIQRHRPPTANYPAPGAIRGVHETSYSFPSGHSVAVTAVLFAMLGLVTLTRGRWWVLLLALGASAFVADSRLLLGVHWFSDVAIGMASGIAWGIVVAIVVRDLTWTQVGLRHGLGKRPARTARPLAQDEPPMTAG